MAKMSIEMYRGVLTNARKLIAKYTNYINGTTENGLIIPVIFHEEVLDAIETINRRIGELNLVIQTLNGSEGKYSDALQELQQIEVQLRAIEKDLLKN